MHYFLLEDRMQMLQFSLSLLTHMLYFDWQVIVEKAEKSDIPNIDKKKYVFLYQFMFSSAV